MPARSKVQQMAMGAALAAKRGKIPVSKLRGASAQMHRGMSEKQLKEFAGTRRKGLPLRKRRRRRRSRLAEAMASALR